MTDAASNTLLGQLLGHYPPQSGKPNRWLRFYVGGLLAVGMGFMALKIAIHHSRPSCFSVALHYTQLTFAIVGCVGVVVGILAVLARRGRSRPIATLAMFAVLYFLSAGPVAWAVDARWLPQEVIVIYYPLLLPAVVSETAGRVIWQYLNWWVDLD